MVDKTVTPTGEGPKHNDTRTALHPSELSAELRVELEKDYPGRPTPELDHLMK
jgi:hypothetical protein